MQTHLSVGKVELSGKITANCSIIKTSKYTDHIGYVTQDDIMLLTITCREKESGKGQTLIKTLHQPIYSMFKKFTRLILLL